MGIKVNRKLVMVQRLDLAEALLKATDNARVEVNRVLQPVSYLPIRQYIFEDLTGPYLPDRFIEQS